MTVGTTTTGDPGSEAVVTQDGTPENVILNFTIPRGATGPTEVAANVATIADPAGTDVQTVAETLNSVIESLIAAGLMEPSAG